ncbi:MAG: isochorismatase family cysteine hydrolase [Sneathiella sp.]|uniref:cysteine hydrolase family protein n=1 Tax=Sneathiella sp. TaxID=1964365 RepID=UPI0030030811
MDTCETVLVDLRTTAVLVVDMINEYLACDGKIICKSGHEIIEPINSITNFCRANSGLILFCNTEINSGNEPIARKWGVHAKANTKSSKVFEKLATHQNDIAIPKISYNAFFKSNLEETLKEQKISTVIVCGIHTHICVLLTAAAAFDIGYNVIVMEDCMTTDYKPNNDTRLRFLSTHIGSLTTSSEFIRINQCHCD